MVDPNRLICRELGMLMNLIKRQTTLSGDEEECGEEITRMHGMLIGYLAAHPEGMLQKEIEEEFSIRRSTVSRILKLMEKKGFIVRTYLENDARQKKIMLTDKALRFHQQIEDNISEIESKLVEGISDEELETFRQVLQKMNQNLKE